MTDQQEELDILISNYINKNKNNKRKLYKKISYIVLFVAVPLFAIGWYFGFKMQMIVLSSYLYGLFIIDSIDWLMERF